jgi:hypothetical protein
MGKKKAIHFNGLAAVVAGCLLGVFLLGRCAGVKPKPTESAFIYRFGDGTYQILSVSSGGNGESYNELWGTGLLAVDLDQDGVIDRILFGRANLADVQAIYAFGIEEVRRSNKLKFRQPTENYFLFKSSGLKYEIRSYRPANAPSFNEFEIVDKRQALPDMKAILLDRNADGTLDEIINGDVALGYAQSRYAEAIEEGLKENALVRVNGTVLVKGE